jgi:hypothetical protein
MRVDEIIGYVGAIILAYLLIEILIYKVLLLKRRPIFCRLNFHSPRIVIQFLPSIDVLPITDVITCIKCTQCDATIARTHLTWDGENMIKVATGDDAS